MTAPPSRRTGIPIPDGDGARADELALGRQVAEAYGLHDVTLTPLPTPVNDVFVVTSSAGRFALKLYHGKRTGDAVRWEVDLVRQLRAHDAPVVQPIRGSRGYVQALTLGGSRRLAVLYSWAPGAKPAPSHQTYHSVGQAAALIHAAGGGIGRVARGSVTTRHSSSTTNSTASRRFSSRPPYAPSCLHSAPG